MLTIPVNHDHMITLNVNKHLLILKCTCHLKTLCYHLQMTKIIYKYFKLYKIYTITDHTIQKLYDHWSYRIKDILVICVFLQISLKSHNEYFIFMYNAIFYK